MSNFWQTFDDAAVRYADSIAIEVQRKGRAGPLQLRRAAAGWRSAGAAWLAARGIAPGERCAILADNGADWCGIYLGVLARGAIAVPLDTNYWPPRWPPSSATPAPASSWQTPA